MLLTASNAIEVRLWLLIMFLTSKHYKGVTEVCLFCFTSVDLIADMYANAAKAAPTNEDILSNLFMAYVRLGDFKKQQQTAMALHRLRPLKNPYYFWAIMSIVMQVCSTFMDIM